jgi:dTDP-4-dehydrorhamnose reductase
MEKKILVTGSSGMVGKSLIKLLKKKNYIILTPSSKKLNLLNQVSIDSFIKKK